MENIKPIQSIPGAFANELGQIKLPDSEARMPHGGIRTYKTKWVFGTKTRASKTARHEYMGIVYRGKNYKIHRLVCEAFHGAAPEGRQYVLHADEDATNNRPENLSWGTQKENLSAPGFVEYCRSRTGENSPYRKGMMKIKGE
jgi:hypothetical protein